MSITKVWVPSKTQAWELADVVVAKEDEITFRTADGEVTLPKAKTHRTDPSHFEDTDDLCSMNHLHEAPLLDVLRRRFHANSIYTTTGDVLISVNPYKRIPGLYDNIYAFLDVPEDGEIDPIASKPHVFKIANYALQALLCGGRTKDAGSRNQSIVVSGESGAGKTEASKHVMSFLIAADQEVNAGEGEVSEVNKRIGVAIGQVLWESNIIFEAFGNAKTVRNDNSSRFGKYIKLQYSEEKRIISAFTETFLLEKSRLVNISANERNYHVFYQFLRGNKDAALADKLKLAGPEKFKMLCDANGVANTSNEDQNYDELSAALLTLGCSQAELTHLWTILACILHMSNINCIQNDDKEGSVQIDSTSLPVHELTEFLGVSEEFFVSRLTTQQVKISTRSSVTMKVLKSADVSNNILALNILEEQGMLNRGAADEGALLSSFNQTHDKKSAAYEKSRFTNDGKFIVKHFAGDVTYIVTGFLEKNNDSLQEDLMELMVCSTNPFIQNAIVGGSSGETSAEGQPGFIGEINPNMIVSSAGAAAAAPVAAAATAGDAKAPVRGGGGKKLATSVTVSFQFRSQLDVLLVTLRATSLHYIKCIKPNTMKVPGVFDSNMVLEQLRYSGALEVVRIRQEGFPIALPFVQFYATFEILSFKRGWATADACTTEQAKQYSATLAGEVLTKDEHQVGHTKVFLRSIAYENMHKSIGIFLGKKVRKFQALVRGKQALRRFRTFVKGLKMLQTFARMFPRRKWFKQKFAEIIEARRREEARQRELARIREEERRKAEEAERARLAAEAEARRQAQEAQEAAEAAAEAERQRLWEIAEAARLAEEARLEAERQAALALAEQKRLEEEAYDARITGLHSACTKGALADVQAMLQTNPDDYFVRNKHNNNCTVFQSALLGGHFEVLRYLAPTLEEMNVRDDLGNVAVHYVAMGADTTNKIEMFRYLSDLVNPNAGVTSALQKMELRPTGTVNRRTSAVGAGVPGSHRWSNLRQGIESTESSLDAALAVHGNNNATGGAGSAVLRAGWLSKRGEGPAWLKRWVVLTNESLMYFRNDKDKVHRDSISFATRNDITIERNPTKATAIDIFLGHSSVKKNRSRISLMAETEVEIQEWMNLLKASAGVESQPLRTSGGVDAVKTVSPALRQALFCLTNSHKESILHHLCKTKKDDSATLMAAAWIVDNGCPVNGHDHKGHSALHLAVQNNLSSFAVFLASKGADPSSGIAGAAGSRTSLDMANTAVLQAKLKEAFFNFKRKEGKFAAAPPRLRGFHYLSLHILKHHIHSKQHFLSGAEVANYYLSASVYNNNNLLVENVQNTRGAVVSEEGDSQLLLWLDTFHVQVPLDNIGDESYIIVELKKAGGASEDPVAWSSFVIDKSSLDSEIVHLHLNAPPKVLNSHNVSVTPSPLDSEIEVEVVISKRTGKETKLFSALL